MADVNKRFQNWALRTEPGRVKATLDSKREDTLRRYMDAVTRLCTMEAKVREVLNVHGVQTISYVPYLDFARQLYKLTRGQEITGESFAVAAQVLLEKWASRGLNPDVLASVRHQVFDIGEPTQP